METRFGIRPRREAAFALSYYALYFAYLMWRQEGEISHWVTLVILPLLGLWWLRAPKRTQRSFWSTVGSVGLVPSRLKLGLATAVGVGLVLQVVQLLNRAQRAELVELFQSGRGPLMLLLAFIVLLGTVAFTEEFFFRGILQTRLTALFRSSLWGVLLTSLLFALYHFPYAYLDPDWASAGDPVRAVQLAMANGILGGLVIGWVFVRAKGNLVATILLHALIDLIPAALYLDRLIGR